MSPTKDRLTAKQARFCEEFMVDMNATRSARAAGYSERTAEQLGYQLLQKPSVKARIAELQDRTAKRLEVTVDGIMADLEELCRGAVAAGQFGPAVRAKELMGKRLGMFRDRLMVDDTARASAEDLYRAIAGDSPRRLALARELLAAPDSFEDTRH